MRQFDSVIIGHTSEDFNIDCEGNTIQCIGGAVIYSSAAAAALGHNVLAVTRMNPFDIQRLNSFTIPRQDVYIIPSVSSTSIRNHYHTPDKERRTCTCLERGTPFTSDDLPADADAQIYHFAGLIYGDFDGEMIKRAAERGLVAVDVQACLRHADTEHGGNMYFEDWSEKHEFLPYIHFLKTDAAEAQILTGLEDREQAARLLYQWGAKEVFITHNTEVLAFDGTAVYTCPIRARNLSGRTGRGDTAFAAYINERLNHSVEDALLTATATVSLKMETPGPLKSTRAQIEQYIKDMYC